MRSQASVQPDTWYHVLWSFDGAHNTTRAYINGQLDVTAELKQPQIESYGKAQNRLASRSPISLGRSAGGDHPFRGVLDDLAIWRRALDVNDAAQIFAAGCGTTGTSNICHVRGAVSFYRVPRRQQNGSVYCIFQFPNVAAPFVFF